MTLLEAVDEDIDGDLPLLAGREATYVTTPHGWKVSRVPYVSARKGRLQVDLHDDGYIYDHEHVEEDEDVYGVPTSAAEARALAELYQEAEDILAAYRAGGYVPPSPLPVYRDNRPKDRSFMGVMMGRLRVQMVRELNRDTFGGLFAPSRKDQFAGVWRAMRERAA